MKSTERKFTSNEVEKQLLVFHDFKITQPRLAVLSLLKESVLPLSSQEISDNIDKNIAGQASVYRILQSFLKAGLVREVNLRHGHIDYELAHEEDDHHHIVCVHCRHIEDFYECDADKITKTILKKSKTFASVHEHTMELFGVCKTCAKKTKHHSKH